MQYDTKLTIDDKFLMFQLASEGKTLAEIKEAISDKVSRQRIYQILRKNGYNPAKVRADKRNKIYKERQYTRYGCFFRDGTIDQNKELIMLARAKFSAKKGNSKNHELGFTVEFKDIQWNTHCPILGLELDYKAKGRQENSVSFDRIDPNKGYVPGNVFIISWRANRIKNDGTAEEHRLISNFMLQHQQ